MNTILNHQEKVAISDYLWVLYVDKYVLNYKKWYLASRDVQACVLIMKEHQLLQQIVSVHHAIVVESNNSLYMTKYNNNKEKVFLVFLIQTMSIS
jgi:hypothetical protein